MDMAVRELAQNHKRSLSGEIEFLVEEAIKNNAEFAQHIQVESYPKPFSLPQETRRTL
jgi:hypothetical protein